MSILPQLPTDQDSKPRLLRPGSISRSGPHGGAGGNTVTLTTAPKYETPAEAAVRVELAYQRAADNYDREVAADMRDKIMGYVDDSRDEYEGIKAEQKQRLSKMDADVASYKAGYNEQWMTDTLSRESQAWDNRTDQAVSAAAKEYAAMGRVASPNVLAAIRRKMSSQKADAMQVRRMQLEQERSGYIMGAMRMQNDVNTNIQVSAPDMSGMYAMLASL